MFKCDMNTSSPTFSRNNEEFSMFESFIEFLVEYKFIYDVNMTKIFCHENLTKIPEEWREALLQLSSLEMNEVPFGFFKECWPDSLKGFLKKAVDFGSFRLQEQLIDAGNRNVDVPSSVKCGMSPKKLNEVVGLAQIIANLCESTGCSAVLDIGSGLGYLGQVLHLNFGYYILGIESDSTNCEKAKARQDKYTICPNIQSKFFHLSENEDSQKQLHIILNETGKPIPCKCSAKYENLGPSLDNGWVLVALHACGPLTPQILNLFANSNKFCGLVCVGCCYHKFYCKESIYNFPSSNKLKMVLQNTSFRTQNESWLLYGLRLAAQETKSRWRKKSEHDHMEHISHLAYRGVLEAFFEENNTDIKWKKPCRRIPKSAYGSFETYYKKALCNQLDILQESESQIQQIYKKFESLFPLLEIISLLQIMLQPVWESLILMDRCQYLKERGLKSELKEFVCEELSPRNIAIVTKQIDKT